MKHRRHQRHRTLLTLGLALPAIAVAATIFLLPPLRSAFPDSPAIDGPRTIALVSALCAATAVLSALVIMRRELFRHHALQERYVQMLDTADRASDLVTILNRRGKIEYANRSVELATGFLRRELVGKRGDPWLPWHADRQTAEDMRRMVLAGRTCEGTIACTKKDGTAFIVEERLSPLRSRNGSIIRIVSTARDVTRQKQVEDRLEYLDRYDPLTAIPNRKHFTQLLDEELGAKRPADGLLAVLIVDIDRFKDINDIFGPEIGDEVLRSITAILRSTAGEQDIIARLGSDEFGVIHQYAATLIDTGALAERIRTEVSRTHLVGGQEITATVTIGVASFPESGKDARQLLRSADMALSQARSRGRNTVQFYSHEISHRIQSSYLLEKRLLDALRNNEYQVHYQPYWDLSTRRVTGAEALIRWHNEDLGIVPPASFIPALEESGRIVDVGEWVLRTACRQIRDWKRMNRPVSIAVNLSLAQVRHRHLVSLVAESIRDANIDPRHLTLELTESICMQDIDFAVTILKKLKDVGVSLSIDDFGTGYSSLSYIKRLPVDTLKIDQSFIRDVSRDPDAASIITAITGMARSLRLKTIAEGVESEEQRNILHLLRCDMGQGYVVSPAVDAREFERILA